jgi:Spy/CpxP family protein refolding chaperone
MEKSPNTWKITAIVLGILNLVLIASIWFRPHPHPPMHPMPPMGPMHENQGHHRGDHHDMPHEMPGDFLAQELHLNPSQLREFNKLRDEHREHIRELQHDGKDLRDEFFKNLESDQNDSAAVKKLAESIAANQEKIELATFDHFESVRKLCDPDQKKIFDNIIAEVLMRMGRPHEKHGPPPMH